MLGGGNGAPHIGAMSEHRDNIFRFRRLKWGAPKRLDGLKAIGLEGEGRPPEGRRGIGGGGVGIVVAAIAAALAVGMGLLGWF